MSYVFADEAKADRAHSGKRSCSEYEEVNKLFFFFLLVLVDVYF